MNRKELVEQIFAKKSFLCVGLDTDIKKVPEHLTKQYEKTEDVIFAFNKAIIDATVERITAIHQWTRILAGQNKSPPSIPKELLSAIPLGERPMQGSSCLHQGQGYATIHDSIEG